MDDSVLMAGVGSSVLDRAVVVLLVLGISAVAVSICLHVLRANLRLVQWAIRRPFHKCAACHARNSSVALWVGLGGRSPLLAVRRMRIPAARLRRGFKQQPTIGCSNCPPSRPVGSSCRLLGCADLRGWRQTPPAASRAPRPAVIGPSKCQPGRAGGQCYRRPLYADRRRRAAPSPHGDHLMVHRSGACCAIKAANHDRRGCRF